jgi:hypothetical protein
MPAVLMAAFAESLGYFSANSLGIFQNAHSEPTPKYRNSLTKAGPVLTYIEVLKVNRRSAAGQISFRSQGLLISS